MINEGYKLSIYEKGEFNYVKNVISNFGLKFYKRKYNEIRIGRILYQHF